ncbi:MAG TPA: universal stress protein [Solirubrobacterales bacterium]|jgi:nucleotide-binding universal stress UspA family protein|nr:universal stress protein [Solirubrobacterales bacterium]
MALYRNILVAIDGSPDATAALRHAAALARDQNALLTLLSVAPNSGASATTAGANPDDPLEFYARMLREAVATLPADAGVKTLLERGVPAEAILATAERDGSDLIVMGSHGHGRFVRALVGSVSERVLKASPVPVLLLRSGPSVDDAGA